MTNCTKCHEDKSDDDFYWRRDRNCLRQPCKTCISDYTAGQDQEKRREISRRSHERNRERNRERDRGKRLEANYGLTLDEYGRMFAEQEGVCAICGREETVTDPRYGQVRSLAVDHNHTTGQVRSLLCARCNMAIGMLDDSDKTLAAALAYLQRWSEAV